MPSALGGFRMERIDHYKIVNIFRPYFICTFNYIFHALIFVIFQSTVSDA